MLIAQSTFLPESKTIFNSTSYQTIKENCEASITEFKVLRDLSFSGDLSPPVIVNDYYLKAMRNYNQQSSFSNILSNDNTIEFQANCLVKIVLMHRIPIRHRNMLLNESSKVMRYFSDTESVNAHIHRIIDIYLVNESFLYIFYESLDHYQSIYVTAMVPSSSRKFPPLLKINSSNTSSSTASSLLNLVNIQSWVHALSQTVLWLAQLGLAHRYIRPEYVFVSILEPTKV